MEEDAQRALKDIKDYDGKQISVVQAKKKLYEKKKGKKKTGMCHFFTDSFLTVILLLLPPFQRMTVSVFTSYCCTDEQKTESSEEPSEVKSQQKSQGMRKNKMKARLIIRNLSFKVSDYEEVKYCDV